VVFITLFPAKRSCLCSEHLSQAPVSIPVAGDADPHSSNFSKAVRKTRSHPTIFRMGKILGMPVPGSATFLADQGLGA